MNKLIVKKSGELSLKKTKNFLDVTRKILTHEITSLLLMTVG